MPVPPRPAVAALAPVVHGAVADAELAVYGLRRQDVIDFSASLNPLGPSPAVLAALRAVDVSRYPEDGAPVLRRALAERLGLIPHQILVGNGSMELLWLLALAYLDGGSKALVVTPAFGEYARACQMMGARVLTLATHEEEQFRPDVAALARLIDEQQPRLTFLCNPNNPTGWLLDRESLLDLAARHRQGLLVVDEAYLPFVAGAPELTQDVDRLPLVLLRSLTKMYGLAGLRLGYVAAHADVTAALERVRPPWSVNAAAQAAGLAALADEEHLARSIEAVQEAKRYVLTEMARLGVPVVAGPANFVLLRVGDGAAVRAQLLQRGLCVRDCASFGLPAHVRIGVRLKEECERLVAALEYRGGSEEA